jgi:hypothetical protein
VAGPAGGREGQSRRAGGLAKKRTPHFGPALPVLARVPQLAGFARVNPLIFHISGSKGRHYKTIFTMASIVLLVLSASTRRICKGCGKWMHRPIELAIRKGEGRHYRPFRSPLSCQINDLRRQTRSNLPKTAASCGSRASTVIATVLEATARIRNAIADSRLSHRIVYPTQCLLADLFRERASN